jgi:hypothetical protein
MPDQRGGRRHSKTALRGLLDLALRQVGFCNPRMTAIASRQAAGCARPTLQLGFLLAE